jgi:predicted secreted acid phosphatase
MNHLAIYSLYPQVVKIDDEAGAFDSEGNKVEIDQSSVDAKALELENIETAKQQAKEEVKTSALAKLTALGLTADEISAITGVK